ncbi:MAG: flagellar hook-length control protein FliK, partial [Deltaproteobacteria bacterium]|nr:flagellar hook-length control protein FliK [Deltaproteobacteria bacterium]
MDMSAISGNAQLTDIAFISLDKVVPSSSSGVAVPDFASSMQQRQVAADQQVDGKVAKNISTEAVESPPVQGADNTPYEYSASSPDDSTAGVFDKQAGKAVVPDEIMYSYVTVMAMLDGLTLEEGTSATESGVSLLSQSAVEEQGVLGAAEPQVREQLPIEQLVQQLMDNSSGNSEGKTAGELVAIISSVVNGGGDEATGTSILTTAMEEQSASGTAEPQARAQLPIEQLIQRVMENTANNSGGKTAGEMAAAIGFAIHGEGEAGSVINGLPLVAENGDIVGNGDGSRINVNLQKQQDAATFTSNSWLESMVDKGADMKNPVASGETATTVVSSPELMGENLFSKNDTALSVSKKVPGQLVTGAGEKMKSAVDQQPHDNIPTSLGDASGQKNAAAKMVFPHSQGTLDQQLTGQKSKADATLSLGLSELSSVKRDNVQIVVNAAGENQFSGLPLSGLKPAVSKGENHLPVTSDDLLNQVTMRLPDRHNSRQVITIQLQPESLGKVEIKLVMEQQKLTAHFVVQHSEVRDVLLKHVSSLHDALVAKGVEVKQVAVEIAPAEKMTGMAVTVDHHS